MTKPERVASGVYRVDAVGFSNAISVLPIDGGDGWTLADAGIGSSAGRIKEALLALGKRPEDLRRIFLTTITRTIPAGCRAYRSGPQTRRSRRRSTRHRPSPASVSRTRRAMRSYAT
jgi:hypothetical protein